MSTIHDTIGVQSQSNDMLLELQLSSQVSEFSASYGRLNNARPVVLDLAQFTTIVPRTVDVASVHIRDLMCGTAIQIVSRKGSIFHLDIPPACFVPILPTR